MRPRRRNGASALAFIDVMSCGLGAVILLFFLVDFKSGSLLNSALSNEVAALDAMVEELTEQSISLESSIEQRHQEIDQLAQSVSSETIREISLDMQGDQAQEQEKKMATKLDEITKKKSLKKNKPAPGVTGQLFGLKVEGSDILILLDTSASMAYRQIVDVVVGIADTSGSKLKDGPKWSQTQKTVEWLLDKAPNTSSVMVLGYAEKADPISNGWISARDQKGMAEIKQRVSQMGPKGGTSLGVALEYLLDNNISPSTVYLVTDGLPTLPGKKGGGFSAFRNCRKIGTSRKYVSGACRVALFNTAVKRYLSHSRTKVNIILLPLEGDPKAAPLHWKWAKTNGGTLFTPAKGWPR